MTAVLTVKSGLDPHLISGNGWFGWAWMDWIGLDWIGLDCLTLVPLGLFGWTSHSN